MPDARVVLVVATLLNLRTERAGSQRASNHIEDGGKWPPRGAKWYFIWLCRRHGLASYSCSAAVG